MKRIKYLVLKFAQNEASLIELAELDSYLKEDGNDLKIQAALLEILENTAPQFDYDEERWNRVKNKLLKNTPKKNDN